MGDIESHSLQVFRSPRARKMGVCCLHLPPESIATVWPELTKERQSVLIWIEARLHTFQNGIDLQTKRRWNGIVL